jgi:hypothetical protein
MSEPTKPSPTTRKAAASPIGQSEHGVNFVVKDPKATQPREVFIFAANISYVLPAASEGA